MCNSQHLTEEVRLGPHHSHRIYFCFLFLKVFEDKVSLCSPVYPGTLYVDQASL